MFQDYPKCLIQGELSVVVFDADGEEAARADGYLFHDEVAPDVPAEVPAETKKAKAK